jgi:hypothetical protein
VFRKPELLNSAALPHEAKLDIPIISYPFQSPVSATGCSDIRSRIDPYGSDGQACPIACHARFLCDNGTAELLGLNDPNGSVGPWSPFIRPKVLPVTQLFYYIMAVLTNLEVAICLIDRKDDARMVDSGAIT